MVISIKDKIKNINAVIGCNIGCRYCYAKAVIRKIKKAWSIFSDGNVRFVSMEKGVA